MFTTYMARNITEAQTLIGIVSLIQTGLVLKLKSLHRYTFKLDVIQNMSGSVINK